MMMQSSGWLMLCVLLLFILGVPWASAEELVVDETPAAELEWGFRPAEGDVTIRTPPSFSWRPQKDAVRYTLQVGRGSDFQQLAYEATDIVFNVHTPPVMIQPNRDYVWRFRYEDSQGNVSPWSSSRSFRITDQAVYFPLPTLEELTSRIPAAHPRLFVRPELMPALRDKAQGELRELYEALVARCERIVANPPDSTEPPTYPAGTVRLSPEWKKIWWGNRLRTRDLLEAAATLGFVYQLDGNEQFGQLGRELLMAAMQWDPKGATGFIYNDEAGMPYAYFGSRAYTFLHDLLSDEERARCQQVMRVRGEEMYHYLNPSHLWRPYGSHNNRAWHFLGEVAVAFQGEIPEADDWLWFAMNVFANVYPVWNDTDGGWHEGAAYWGSYIGRFTWWADIMNTAMDINAYKVIPYFTQIGYYPIYLLPPGTQTGGLGDQMEHYNSSNAKSVMSIFAAQAQNPYWQWYVDVQGGVKPQANYIDFVRAALSSAVEPKEPTDLPTSRAFWGTGQAYLNTTLLDAKDNVQLLFKSSPMGSYSHGFESQNTFVLRVAGEPVLIRSGKRDLYGTPHHVDWMMQTKAVNSITVNGQSQLLKAQSIGRLTNFHSSDRIDLIEGEAADAYPPGLVDRFTRTILFVKPDLLVIYDRLATPEPATFEWRLHAPVPMERNGQEDIHVANTQGATHVAFLHPRDLELSYTDEFDTPPDEELIGYKLVHYHLTASIVEPTSQATFVTVLRPHRTDAPTPPPVEFEEVEAGYVIRAATGAGDAPDQATVLLRKPGSQGPVQTSDATGSADITAILKNAQGEVITKAEFHDPG